MKRFLAFVVALALASGFLFAGGQPGAGEKTYKITAGIGLNDKSAQYESLVYFKERYTDIRGHIRLLAEQCHYGRTTEIHR